MKQQRTGTTGNRKPACRHADARGFCANAASNFIGSRCSDCEDSEAADPLVDVLRNEPVLIRPEGHWRYRVDVDGLRIACRLPGEAETTYAEAPDIASLKLRWNDLRKEMGPAGTDAGIEARGWVQSPWETEPDFEGRRYHDVDAEGRLRRIEAMDADRLRACLADETTQKTVAARIRARLRKLGEAAPAEGALGSDNRVHFQVVGGSYGEMGRPACPPHLGGETTAAVVLAGDGVRVTLDGNAPVAAVARAVAAQWGRAQAGLVEVLRFGAVLLAVRDWLEREGMGPAAGAAAGTGPGGEGTAKGNAFFDEERVRNPGHGWNKGTGLRTWMAEHCPEVNYKTAMGYLRAAEGLRVEARLAEGVPLLALMGAETIPEARAERLRLRVMRSIEGGSLALLRAAAREAPAARGGAREGAGRPPLPHSAEVHAGAAWHDLGKLIDKAMGWHFAAHLPGPMAREALATVEALRDALKARVQELKNADG